MSGFDKDWLSLREPADRAARAAPLVGMLSQYLSGQSTPHLIDIGCGTGSTWRALHAELRADTHWLLLDHDPLLLAEAERQIGSDNQVAFAPFDLTDLTHLPLEDVAMVTASALFDLVSEDFCKAFAERLADAGCGLYAALNYDGLIRWSHVHPLDETMVAAFNRHQQTDKGFGPALGPGATDCLETSFSKQGYRVQQASSPWYMDATHADLQRGFLEGFRLPLQEMRAAPHDAIEDWLAFRLDAIHAPGSQCEVGHRDFLALPD